MLTQEYKSRKMDLRLKKTCDKNTKKNIWIVKPGEETNRGYGITVCETMKEIEEIITKK